MSNPRLKTTNIVPITQSDASKTRMAEQAATARATTEALKGRPDVAQAANTARATKVNGGQPVVTTIVPTAPAHNATDKAPHTRRAIAQHKEEDKVTAAQAKVDASLSLVTETTTNAKTAKKTDPDRQAKFAAKAKAEVDYLASKKALASLRRAQDPKVVPTEPKAPRATKAPPKSENIKVGPTPNVEKPTWGCYMIKVAQRNKTTEAARQDHAKSAEKAGYPPTKPLDFKWMHAKGYIILS